MPTSKKNEDPKLYNDLSIPLDFFISLSSKELDSLVANIADEIELSETRNKRASNVQEKFVYAIRVIVLNLLYIRHRSPDAILGIPLNNNDIQPKGRYSSGQISVNTYQDAYNGLLKCNYIRVALEPIIGDGKRKGRRTRITSTEKLNNLFDKIWNNDFLFFERPAEEEVVKLKDGNKELIDYVDNPYTYKARDNLSIINQRLTKSWYDLCITDEQYKELAKQLRQRGNVEANEVDNDQQPLLVDMTARKLYRVFNNGDFEQGGRFYGGWWQQIPRALRKFITVDTKQTVELDFANLHPWILYARKGIYLDLKTYDAYKVSDKINRKYSKLAFNMLINAKRKPNPPDGFDENKAGASWEEILNTVIAFHPEISEFIASGEGIKLQNKDAEMAEGILLHFSNMQYPCLPLHDSFIVHYALKDELQERMLFEFQRLYGHEIKIDQKPSFELYEGIESIGERTATFDPDTVFNNTDYAGYEHRWGRWLEYKNMNKY